MKLTDAAIKNAKPQAKQFKLSDGSGLYLLITPSGGKLWRFKYRFGGKEKLLALGGYPIIGLKEARTRRDAAKVLLAADIDPSEQKKEAKAIAIAVAREQASTFEAVTREWYAKKTAHLTPDYRKQIISRLENMIFPHIGSKPFSALEPSDILVPARQAESRGAVET